MAHVQYIVLFNKLRFFWNYNSMPPAQMCIFCISLLYRYSSPQDFFTMTLDLLLFYLCMLDQTETSSYKFPNLARDQPCASFRTNEFEPDCFISGLLSQENTIMEFQNDIILQRGHPYMTSSIFPDIFDLSSPKSLNDSWNRCSLKGGSPFWIPVWILFWIPFWTPL